MLPLRLPRQPSAAAADLVFHNPCRALGYDGGTGSCSAQQNGFTTLPASIFAGLPKLSALYMQCLPIQMLPADTFTPLTALNSLFWCVLVVGSVRAAL